MRTNVQLTYRPALKSGDHDPYRYANARLGMWAWIAQRVSALAIVIFITLHVLLTYKPLIQFALLLCVVFHAALGLRVIFLDFNVVSVKYQKALVWGLTGLGFVVLCITWFSIY